MLDLNCGLFQGMFNEGNVHCLVWHTQMFLEIEIKRKQNRLKDNLTRGKISIEGYPIFQTVMLSFLLKIVRGYAKLTLCSSQTLITSLKRKINSIICID